jgi:hypothetical protein
MQMDANEDSAIKETLEETRGLAAKMEISLSEALQLRQLVALRYLCQTKTSEMKS